MYCARCLTQRILTHTLTTDPPAHAITVSGGEALCGPHAVDALAEVTRWNAAYEAADTRL